MGVEFVKHFQSHKNKKYQQVRRASYVGALPSFEMSFTGPLFEIKLRLLSNALLKDLKE